MTKVLVTGGAGFIGNCFVRHMLKKYPDYQIINLDALTYAGNIENLDDVKDNPNYKFVKGNICDKKLVNKLMSEVDMCVHFAAESHVDRSITGPEIFIETNVMGTQILLEGARHNKIKKYLQVSTDEVYGSLGPTGLFTEDTPLAPNSPYSASKTGADLLVRAYYETYKMPVLTTRCSNNYGPYQYPEKLIPFFIKQLLAGEKVPVYGDGLNVRDWLYVYDHCEAIDAVLHKGKDGGIYNIGGNNEKTNMEITKIVLEGMGKDESSIKYVEDRLGHDKRYAIDSSKMKNELGWEPKVNFEDGIKITIDWYLKNQEWIKNIEKKLG
ncbi:MAG: dTDP-glucose 4,6-dehydratase [Elusimicrobiaceae bacterium]|nr:dTDP-glucose 4,6-dehydratase [Elusimicrobiaceae bacterium]MBT3954951.1 dTDP-glucose 4,6-dehydratase [Elusimicrobiaceae bacterium]MBT4008601.1 dTDP-glucose 4,6-dehydratase [Elusimicrobiaceae bacterium]MBT4402961.1 dTDP-glucose 4,6-dehydratase [Elusimicrobiaceae bacterium]MBT4439767.1 dTDP-glucose 4,6-dehydratase [Elusimicrobiaceae bacterium]